VSLVLPDTGAEVLPDGRRIPLSARRNAAPILEVLRAEAPKQGRMLELAAGSGLHSALFAEALPGLDWQPSDLDAAHFASITAWAALSAGNIRAPLRLDATQAGWGAGLGRFDALLLVNLLHLIPAMGAETLLAGLSGVLAPGGTAFLYGPFLRDGQATSPGDAAFDASLRAQDPDIGYKDLAWVQARLDLAGMSARLREMPANNLMLVVRQT
jgi:SAM-dependent methyltransferase